MKKNECFEKLTGKRIFITGGTGFFGKSILSYWKRMKLCDIHLTVLSRFPELFLNSNPEFKEMRNVSWCSGDIRCFEFPKQNFDYIVHAATPASTMFSPGEMTSVIIDGTQRVIDFARYANVQRLMMTSSGAVYGVQPPDLERIPEDFSCAPVTEYGKGKLIAEQMCMDSGIYALLPRCFAFVGPYLNRNIHFAIGNFIRDCLCGCPITINGDGTPLRSYLYADDLVEWLFAILVNGDSGRPYNLGSDVAVSIYALAEKVRDVIGSDNEINVIGVPVPGVMPARYIPDISRAKNELGLDIKYNLEEAIRNSLVVSGSVDVKNNFF